MAYIGISSTLGIIVPREERYTGTGAFIETTAAPYEGDPGNLVGSLDVNGHTYEVYNGRDSGYKYVRVYRDGTLYSTANVNTFTSDYSGFWCDIVNELATVYWISCPDPSAVAGYTFPLTTGYSPGMPYVAGTIVSGVPVADLPVVAWDETPSTNRDDPDNLEPRGGDYADLEPFGQTDIMLESGLPNPEVEQNMTYGGMIRTYVMSSTELASISTMFTGSVWDDLKQKFGGVSNPFDFILNTIQVPFAPTNLTSGVAFRLGGYEVTGSSVSYTVNRYIKFKMGSITLKEIWGTARDYSDCSMDLYLPYCGVKQVDPEICINATNTLYAYLDIWTGDVTYLLHVSNTNSSGKYFRSESVPYRWTGNCAKKVPLGRVDNSNQVLAAVGAIAGLGMAATGAMAAPAAMSEVGGLEVGMKSVPLLPTAGGVASLLQAFKPTIQTSGGIAGAQGAMDYQKAYFIVKRAVPQYPNGWRAQFGAPRYQTFDIADLSGFTLFSDILLDNMGVAVEEEIQELKRLLTTEGVIL